VNPTDDAPVTGDPQLDDALAQVARLGAVELSEHPAVLRQAVEALQQFLRTGPGAP
jgi:hypothetical protein